MKKLIIILAEQWRTWQLTYVTQFITDTIVDMTFRFYGSNYNKNQFMIITRHAS
jgi:hypothetical protein